MSTHLIKENRSLLLEEDFFVSASLVRRVLQLHSVLSCWFVLVGLLDTATGCVFLRCLPCASLVRLALSMLSCNVLALGRRSVSQPVLAALGLFVVGDSAPSELGCRVLLSVLLLCAVRVARQRRCTALIFDLSIVADDSHICDASGNLWHFLCYYLSPFSACVNLILPRLKARKSVY